MAKILIVLTAINLVFNFSVHNQGQNSKTISKNKSMHLLIYDCCETHFHYCMFSRSFIRHNATELFLFFYCTSNVKQHSTKFLTKSTSYDVLKSNV